MQVRVELSRLFFDKHNICGAVWDTSMITKLAGADTEENLNTWTAIIVNEINNGSYKPLVPEWLNCTDPSDALVCLHTSIFSLSLESY